MTLDEYNETAKAIFTEQQSIAQQIAQLAMAGKANPTTSEFGELLTKQWSLMQQIAKLNTEMMMGVMSPKK